MRNKKFILAAICLSLFGTASQACVEPYPISMVNKFKEQCSSKDINMVGYCACVIGKIQKTVPLGEFIEIGNNKTDVANDKRFTKATAECAAKPALEVDELVEHDKPKASKKKEGGGDSQNVKPSLPTPANPVANSPVTSVQAAPVAPNVDTKQLLPIPSPAEANKQLPPIPSVPPAVNNR